MLINIVFKLTEDPRGGGNQFLKALKNQFEQKGVYTNIPGKADFFLFNSYQYINEVIQLKRKYPKKLFIHRIDGPIRLYSKMSDKRDFITNSCNKYLADATIFQSEWSRLENYRLGLKKNKFEIIIGNAPDSNIFNNKNKEAFAPSKKVKLIATSWSSNFIKGFAVYKWLDNNLDFNKYEMTFCGNSPVYFKNIRQIPPLPSYELAILLKQHDIFITASQKDPCSNSLIEALHCGLPAIALNDGGHPEIIGKSGKLFRDTSEIPQLIDELENKYNDYQNLIEVKKIDEIADNYIDFIEKKIGIKNEAKKFGIRKAILIYQTLYIHKIFSFLS